MFAIALIASAAPARAEATEVRISKGYGVLFCPLMVMEQRKLLKKKPPKPASGGERRAGSCLDGGNMINDAMLSVALDIAGTGAPGLT